MSLPSARARFASLLGLCALCAGAAPGSDSTEMGPTETRARPPMLGVWANLHEQFERSPCEVAEDPAPELERLARRLEESGARAVTVGVPWDWVTAETLGDHALIGGAMERGYSVLLNLAPVWSDALTTPAALGERPFSAKGASPGGLPVEATIEHARQLIDALVRVVPEQGARLHMLVLGNEVDLFRGAFAAAEGKFFLPDAAPTRDFDGYLHFLRVVAPYARERLGVRVGVSFTHHAALDPQWRLAVHSVLAATDALVLTYHGEIDQPGTFAWLTERLPVLYPHHDIVFQEVGLSLPDGGGQEQAVFVHEVFDAVEAASSPPSYVGFFSLHDWFVAPEPCTPVRSRYACHPCDAGCSLCGAGNDPQGFIVRNSGLLGSDDTPKPAWEAFRRRAAAWRAR